MKQVIVRIAALIILCPFFFLSFAQDEVNTEFINRMNYIFSPLEKNRVPNGLLLDYSMEFTELKNYNGILTDSNKLSADILREIYSTVFTSAIHTNAGGFYSPDYIDSIWQLQRQPGIITLSGVYYNYSRFRDDAVSTNLITVSNEQVYDRYVNGVWQNPYQTETVFAMSPPLQVYSGKTFQVALPSNLWFTNNSGSVSSIAVNFNDGAGYRTLTMGQAVNINYAETGSKTWTFRLTLSNNTTLYSHTEMKIEPEPNDYGSGGCSSCRFPRPGGPVFLIADDPYLGELGEGWITIDYANADLRLHNPLIVVEGFDPGYLLRPENQFGETSFFTFRDQLRLSGSNLDVLLRGNNQQYDIIYVDWRRGADYLQRNGYFLERVIRWVNEQKAIDGIVAPNVVLGQSMGGVITRWALRDMENRNLNHQTRLFISWDAPQLGANVPVAYQHAYRHANSLFLQSAIPYLLGGNSTIRMVKNALRLSDYPAPSQMLYNKIDYYGQLNNTAHNTWQTELRNMGYPQQCRNVAVSNGSECGAGQGFQPGAILLSINGKANTSLLGDIIGMPFLPLVGYFTGQPALFLGVLPGRNDFVFDFQCNAQPESSTIQIYKGKITYTKKVLWLVNVNTTITNRVSYSDPSVLPIDGTPGGMYDIGLNTQNPFLLLFAQKYNLSISSIPQFNFMPTVSALDIGGGNTSLTMADYRASYVGANPPPAPKNTPFANFTTAFNQVQLTNGQISNNENHIQIATRNGNFVAEELNGNMNVRIDCSAFCTNGVITGTQVFCNNSTFTAPFGNGVTYTWSVSDPNLIALTPNGNTVLATRNNGADGGRATLTVNMTGDCGTSTLSIQLYAGVPDRPVVLDENGEEVTNFAACTNEYISISPIVDSHWDILEWEWEKVVGNFNLLPFGNYAQIIGFQSGFGFISVRVRNACGWSNPTLIVVNIMDCGMGMQQNSIMLYPNPASNSVTLFVDSKKISQQKTGTPASINEVKIYDAFGAVKLYRKFDKQQTATLNISELPKGLYVVEVNTGSKKEYQQLVIQK